MGPDPQTGRCQAKLTFEDEVKVRVEGGRKRGRRHYEDISKIKEKGLCYSLRLTRIY